MKGGIESDVGAENLRTGSLHLQRQPPLTVQLQARRRFKQKRPRCQMATGPWRVSPQRDLAATYSPTHRRSTIGAAGLNYSVRYGKRCFPCAIATKNLVSYESAFSLIGLKSIDTM